MVEYLQKGGRGEQNRFYRRGQVLGTDRENRPLQRGSLLDNLPNTRFQRSLERRLPTPLELARAEPDSLKGQILATARRLFARRGFHGTSTRGIAAEVGVDVSTLYYHWGSKQDLFEGILSDLQIDFEERLRVWILESRDLSLEGCFDLAVERIGPFFLNHDVVRVLLFTFFDEDYSGRGWASRSQRQLVDTLRTFTEKRFGTAAVPPEFDLSILSLVSTTLTLVGNRQHLAAILDLDPEGAEYAELVTGTLRRLIGSFVLSLSPSDQLAPSPDLTP